MKFRPCIDIHNGKVKQIVGSTLRDEGDSADENYVSERGAAYYAGLFRRDGLSGGHVILLNHRDSPWYAGTRAEAMAALSAWPGGLQAGGGITDENAAEFLDAGASHVIVTSFVFSGGEINYDHLARLVRAAGKERIVLDLSCRRLSEADPGYHIMTDRWQKAAETTLDGALMEKLSGYCSEFLVHAVAAEGKGQGIDAALARILAGSPVPVTYAGGVRSAEDIRTLFECGEGKVDYTVGSALDLYGGHLSYAELASGGGMPDRLRTDD